MAHKHKIRLKLARQMLGHCEAERAKSASDQVDAATLKTRMIVRGRKRERFERFNEALAAAPRNRGVFAGAIDLGDELRRRCV